MTTMDRIKAYEAELALVDTRFNPELRRAIRLKHGITYPSELLAPAWWPEQPEDF